jgi:hypothetical protein
MARERYLVGVSKEELEYKSLASPPATPKGKLAHFWDYHKGAIIGAAVALAIAAFFIVQTVTRVKPDYQICMATMTTVPEVIVAQMEQELQAYGVDLNGDGKVVVSIQNLNVSMEDSASYDMAAISHQTVLAHMAAQDVLIYAFAPDYYDNFKKALDEDLQLFAPVEVENETVGENGTYFNWNVLEMSKNQWGDTLPQEWEEYIPEELYVGVRAYSDSMSEKQRTETDEAMALIRNYLTNKKMTDPSNS